MTQIHASHMQSDRTSVRHRGQKAPADTRQTVEQADVRIEAEPVEDHIQQQIALQQTAGASQYKQQVFDLASHARLFVDENNGQLRRALPFEVKERLDQHQPVFVVTAQGVHGEESSSSGSSSYDKMGWVHHSWENSSRSEANGSTRVVYTAAPLNDWGSLDWIDPKEAGVPGVAQLPASGSEVTTDSHYESDYQSESHREYGFWNAYTEDRSSASHYASR